MVNLNTVNKMQNFRKNIENMYGDKGKAWLASLSQAVTRHARIWNLTDLKPIKNLSFNYVLTGVQNAEPVVLKLVFEQQRLEKEVQALGIFQSYGGVGLKAHTSEAILLEHIVPGHSLKSYLPDRSRQALQIICAVTKRLHQSPLPVCHPFPHIKDLLNTLDENWELPLQYLEKARKLKNKLILYPEREVILHGDLHHDNILTDGRHWQVIDPQGIKGYPINEIWAFILDPVADIQYAAQYFDYDVITLRQWYYVHIMLSACWNLTDNRDPAFFLDIAKQVYNMVDL